MMNYPLELTFKLLAFGNQVFIKDAAGHTVAYVKQKIFTLKSDITVFADETETRPLYYIKAEKVFAVSPKFNFTDASGKVLGAVQQQGVRSLWRAHFDIFNGQATTPQLTVTEANPWLKVADHLLTEIPIVGLFHNYILHPAYNLDRGTGTTVLRLEKKPSLIGRRFAIERLAEVQPDEEEAALLSLFIVVIMERQRG